MTVAGHEPDLTDEEVQALFRIADEALINVERHAAAQQVTVRLAFGNDRMDLVIQDDGVGFDPPLASFWDEDLDNLPTPTCLGRTLSVCPTYARFPA